jgi:hypothetical protein
LPTGRRRHFRAGAARGTGAATGGAALAAALLLGLCVGLGLGGCGAAEPRDLSARDETAIYAAVVERVCGPNGPIGDVLKRPVVFIVDSTDDRAADPSAEAADSEPFPASLRVGISAALAGLPPDIAWTGSIDDVTVGASGRVRRDGAVVTLGNLEQRGRRILVPASVYAGGLGAGGTTYQLVESGGYWIVIGTTGGTWVS